MIKNNAAKVTLVGAGPGDPKLITLAGIEAIKSADVILYDALANPVLLDWAPNAKKIFVGKRNGYKSYEQDEINYLIVSHAYESGHVVRLKGGDAFVFGRATEEIKFVKSFSIPVSVIPGISSALAGPTSEMIPLTQRGVSQSFWVLTGTTQVGKLNTDIQLAAQSSATVVILMGMSKLKQIVDIYKQLGNEKQPVAIIQNATCKDQKSCVGSMDSIVEMVRDNNMSNPAVIIIGDVVSQGETAVRSLTPQLKNWIR